MKFMFFIPSLFLVNSTLYSQDWCSWSFQYDFKIENNGIGSYSMEGLEILIDDPFESNKFQGSDFKYIDSTKESSLYLNYGCISCGYGDLKTPPVTFFRIYLHDTFRSQHISILIPLTFDEMDEQRLAHYHIGTIYFNDFIHFNSEIERYEGLRVKNDRTVIIYQKGEYDFPSTNKLLSVFKRLF